MQQYFKRDGSIVSFSKELGSGGEGKVYQLDNSDEVLKIYKPGALTYEKKQKIEAIAFKRVTHNGICLPSDIVFDDKRGFAGYIMPKADGHELQLSVFNPQLLKQRFPNWNRINLTNLALTILDKISYLHSHNIIVGDINPYNILIKSDSEVYFVDTDSFQVENFPCPVGTAHFTPPELQGKDYGTFLRTPEHEYFAVATLLFMIFLPGKPPYSYQGGGNITENIKAMNFSYPLGDEDNLQAPQGMWEFIWTELPYDVRKAFYTVFKEDQRLSIQDWITVIESYKTELERGSCALEILPANTEKILTGRTLNMNRRDIKASDQHLRVSRTDLRPNATGENFGVLELSTKAVKLLIGDRNNIEGKTFTFEHFYRDAVKTETGRGLDTDNSMDMDYFSSNVLPYISKMVRTAKAKKVDILHTVATAAYRTAINRDEIVHSIKDECGLNVKILSKKEEALATLTAFFFSRPSNINYSNDENVIMIDQGGGSTEISLFRGNEMIDTYSLNLGSTVLKTILFKEATINTPLGKAFSDSEKLVKDRLKTFYSSPKAKLLAKSKSNLCISVGTAITSATNKKGNARQHGTKLTLDQIKNKISDVDQMLKERYSNVQNLLDNLESEQGGQGRDRIDNLVVMRVGLPMYVEIMQHFNIDEVVISGTGLWYGIYFENLYNINS